MAERGRQAGAADAGAGRGSWDSAFVGLGGASGLGYAVGMATIDNALTIRSRFARERAAELARRTGMTATQVVEEALRAYAPPVEDDPPKRLVRRGRLLVLAGGPRVSQAEADEALEAARYERE